MGFILQFSKPKLVYTRTHTAPACIWWNIWKERNQRILEGKEFSIQKIKWKVITSLGFWCKEQNIEEEIHLVDFVGP